VKGLFQKRAWIWVDVGNSAFATTILAAVFPQYLPSLLPEGGVQLSLGPLSWQTAAISLWGYSVSFSIFVTLILSLLLGQWADHKGKRRFLFALFTLIGALATIGLGFTSDWKIALSLFILASTGFAASNVFYNSLLACVAPEKEWDSLSLKAYAWGYIAGGLVLAVNLLMIMKHEWFFLDSMAAGTRASFVMVGIWWLVWAFPAATKILETAPESIQNARVGRSIVVRHLSQLFNLLKDIPKVPGLLFFILAFMFFNDGIQTTISMSAIFGKEVLALGEGSIIGAFLMIQIVAWPLTLGMIKLSEFFGPKRLLSFSLIIWMGISVYAFFMQTALDFWILGFAVASVLGVSQALSRSIYARLIPRGRQAEFFSLYAFSGKFSSIFGPLLFGIITDITGSARISILAIGVFFLIGLILLQLVSIDRPKPAN